MRARLIASLTAAALSIAVVRRVEGSQLMHAIGASSGAFVMLLLSAMAWTTAALSRRPSAGLVAPFGWRARRVLPYIYGRKTMAEVFLPLLGDIEAEYLGHLTAGEVGFARVP